MLYTLKGKVIFSNLEQTSLVPKTWFPFQKFLRQLITCSALISNLPMHVFPFTSKKIPFLHLQLKLPAVLLH